MSSEKELERSVATKAQSENKSWSKKYFIYILYIFGPIS